MAKISIRIKYKSLHFLEYWINLRTTKAALLISNTKALCRRSFFDTFCWLAGENITHSSSTAKAMHVVHAVLKQDQEAFDKSPPYYKELLSNRIIIIGLCEGQHY